MKFHVGILFLMASFMLPSGAWAIGFETDVAAKYCRGIQTNSDQTVIQCKGAKNFKEVQKAEIGENLSDSDIPNLQVYDALDLGVLPDDSTDSIYDYFRALLDGRGRIIGYLAISGYRNTEMDVKVQITARYNLKSELVSAKVK